MLKEVGQALPLGRVVEAPSIDSNRAVCHGITLCELLLVVVLDEEHLHPILQGECLVQVLIPRRLIHVNQRYHLIILII